MCNFLRHRRMYTAFARRSGRAGVVRLIAGHRQSDGLFWRSRYGTPQSAREKLRDHPARLTSGSTDGRARSNNMRRTLARAGAYRPDHVAQILDRLNILARSACTSRIRAACQPANRRPTCELQAAELCKMAIASSAEAIPVRRPSPSISVSSEPIATQAQHAGSASVLRVDSRASRCFLRLAPTRPQFPMRHRCKRGVLHHMADLPGRRLPQPRRHRWRPGGAHGISVSAAQPGRHDVVAARAFIAGRALAARRAGRDPALPPGIARHARSPASALYRCFTTSECRDLLFHVQEARMTIPPFRHSSETHGLAFVGFNLNSEAAQHYQP